MIRAFAAACAVGLVVLTLTLGSLRHPTTAVSSLPEPPLSHPVVPPVVIAPQAPASPRHPRRQTRMHVTAHPHRVAAKRVAVRPTVVLRPAATTRTEPTRSSPHPKKRSTPKPPSARPSGPPVTTPTTPPMTPPPTTAPPVASPPAPTPPVSTVPTTPPPVVTVPSETKKRPGNGRGDSNHDHTGPPGHSKSHDSG
jgi:hypothetical protein